MAGSGQQADFSHSRQDRSVAEQGRARAADAGGHSGLVAAACGAKNGCILGALIDIHVEDKQCM